MPDTEVQLTPNADGSHDLLVRVKGYHAQSLPHKGCHQWLIISSRLACPFLVEPAPGVRARPTLDLRLWVTVSKEETRLARAARITQRKSPPTILSHT